MTSKTLLLLFALLAISLAVSVQKEDVLAEPQCDCGTITGVLMKTVGKIRSFLTGLVFRALQIPGCGFEKSVKLVVHLVNEVLYLLASLFGLAIPQQPSEEPYQMCHGFESLVNDFRALINDLISDDQEFKRCDCQVPNALRDFVNFLIRLLQRLDKYLGGGDGTEEPPMLNKVSFEDFLRVQH
ncbi:hypothetical protein QR680_011677 [Steinernema hermaphroditum]|uniref:Uncharacterized protein n=1 Tax=Steinernema hermaphroditum TaxID=289476 RepID=A0AA39LZC8_9BILA|nr:hypothetical protein QR680_011677 [Steinernema hermaphroditum]